MSNTHSECFIQRFEYGSSVIVVGNLISLLKQWMCYYQRGLLSLPITRE